MKKFVAMMMVLVVVLATVCCGYGSAEGKTPKYEWVLMPASTEEVVQVNDEYNLRNEDELKEFIHADWMFEVPFSTNANTTTLSCGGNTQYTTHVHDVTYMTNFGPIAVHYRWEYKYIGGKRVEG